MTERDSMGTEPFQRLAETVAKASVEVLRYRDFIARKAARQWMDDNGLVFEAEEHSNAEQINASLEYACGTCVATGIALGLRGETSKDELEEQADRLTGQLPPPLDKSIGKLVPHLITYGVAFHRDRIAAGDEEVAEWTKEFTQIQAADPDHELWGE